MLTSWFIIILIALEQLFAVPSPTVFCCHIQQGSGTNNEACRHLSTARLLFTRPTVRCTFKSPKSTKFEDLQTKWRRQKELWDNQCCLQRSPNLSLSAMQSHEREGFHRWVFLQFRKRDNFLKGSCSSIIRSRNFTKQSCHQWTKKPKSHLSKPFL